jgi:signal transduction histidine kinase
VARRALETVADRRVWRLIALPLLRLPVSTALLAIGIAPVLLTAWLLLEGAYGLSGPDVPRYVGPWELGPVTGLVLWALALPSAILAMAVLGGVGSLSRALTRTLVRRPAETGGPIREILAESLGDRSLSVAYWLPDREVFVDDAGRPVQMPAPGTGRAWTAVEREGRRVAAIVHDAELQTSPELVHTVAAAAALALDNERLKADLRARVEDLRVSRVRIVEAADAARRRIERDLHDGAQQQLVSLALDLRMLRARLRETEAAPLVDELSAKLQVALAELRDLARGIHPTILTERGLEPAVEALAARAPVPVDVDVDTGGRLTAAIEAAAYFTVAEGLTNVGRYAGAQHASVRIHRQSNDVVVVVVEDDGVGGAELDRGSGLRGLQDRLSALDGTLHVSSPDGGGTRLEARIPCGAADLVADAHESVPDQPADEPVGAEART